MTTPPQQPSWQPPGQGHAPPPAASTQVPSFEHSTVGASTTTTGSVKNGGGMAARLGLGAALGLAAIGGAYAVSSALDEPAGAQSADEAINDLFVAIDNDDLLGVAEVMLPAEREAIIDPSLDLVAELERLGITDADDTDFTEYDYQVADITFSPQVVDPRMTMVTLTGGTVTTVDTTGQHDTEVVDVTEMADIPIAVVEDDGSWYVSLTYTAAEQMRTEAGQPFPGLGNGPTPVGGESPEDAVEQLVRASIRGDANGVIAQLDPEEMAAVYDYAPIIVTETQAVVGTDPNTMTVDGGTLTVHLDGFEASSQERNGRTVVSLEQLEARIDAAGPDVSESVTVTYGDGCWTLLEPGSDGEIMCVADMYAELYDIAPDLELLGLDDMVWGVTTVERDGRWYVSVVPSMLGLYTDFLAGVTDEEATQIRDAADSFLDEGAFWSFDDPEGGTDCCMPEEDIVEEPPATTVPPTTTPPTTGPPTTEAGAGQPSTTEGAEGSGATTRDADDPDEDEILFTQFRVVKAIPVGTPAAVLESDGYVEVYDAVEELDVEAVWWMSEIEGESALREIAVGEVLMVDDFG